MQDINEVIYMFPKEKDGEVLRGAESRPKMENAGTGIYQLVIYFDSRAYKSGKRFFMRKQYSKIRDRIIHESSNKNRVHENFYKVRYKEICR